MVLALSIVVALSFGQAKKIEIIRGGTKAKKVEPSAAPAPEGSLQVKEPDKQREKELDAKAKALDEKAAALDAKAKELEARDEEAAAQREKQAKADEAKRKQLEKLSRDVQQTAAHAADALGGE